MNWRLVRNTLITASIPTLLWFGGHPFLALIAAAIIGAYLVGAEILWVHSKYM